MLINLVLVSKWQNVECKQSEYDFYRHLLIHTIKLNKLQGFVLTIVEVIGLAWSEYHSNREQNYYVLVWCTSFVLEIVFP